MTGLVHKAAQGTGKEGGETFWTLVVKAAIIRNWLLLGPRHTHNTIAKIKEELSVQEN